MTDEASTIHKILNQFVNVVPKTQQGLRLFKEFYRIRMDGYKKLRNRFSLNVFKSKEDKEAERQQVIAILRTNNERERKVFLEIYANAYNELKPHLELLRKRWKKEAAELNIMYTYFEEVFSFQKSFLDKELLFLDNKISTAEFASLASAYFSKLERMSENITRQYGAFYSPVDFEKTFKQKLASHALKEADLVGYLVVFVGLFAGINNFNHSMPSQLIDVEKLPTGPIFLEFVLICYVLTKLNAPVKVWSGIKEYSKKIIIALGS